MLRMSIVGMEVKLVGVEATLRYVASEPEWK